MPTAIMSSTENIRSLVPVDNDLATCNKARKVVSDVHSSIDLQCLPLTKTMNGISDGKAVSHFQQNDCVNSTKEQQGYRFDCNSVPTNQMKPQQLWQDTRSRTTSLLCFRHFTSYATRLDRNTIHITMHSTLLSMAHRRVGGLNNDCGRKCRLFWLSKGSGQGAQEF